MSPTVEEVRLHCRIDDDAEDSLLTAYITAAASRAGNYLNRTLYADEVPDTDSDGLLIAGEIKQALLLAVGFWYGNREAQALPDGFYLLLAPYRYIPL
ncbi:MULTISPECIES: head-tail connector protein [unclassified Tatumella]|uniref:head-tail connector protein n=1 Tax=unclassified Tatumella TaxID=2649542 RepID=UPI001BB00421|nr:MULTISPECIES: head-tail connector protein [unclassified Tatumella]MBS0878584.1 phage gp6-like head-tail connector protein [Tatumella sp. JGM82]MBS0892081.1 phage gp6-like head-tail connector protein [Tatumella sp. JGM94]MBS0900860.1 phage gp6-like head-tail connector protein [Tatumella sp. JGM100]